MYASNSDIIYQEYSLLKDFQEHYAKAWSTDAVQEFTDYQNSDTTVLLRKDKAFADAMLRWAIMYNNWSSVDDVNAFLDGLELPGWVSDAQKVYLEKLHLAMKSFINEIRLSSNDEMVWVFENRIEKSFHKLNEDWYRLNVANFFALSDKWNLETNPVRALALMNPDAVSMLTDKDPATMKKAIATYFGEGRDWLVDQNAFVIRNAFHNMIGSNKRNWFEKAVSRYLWINTPYLLTKYYLSIAGWGIMALSAGLQSYMNQKTMVTKRKAGELVKTMEFLNIMDSEKWLWKFYQWLQDWNVFKAMLEPMDSMIKGLHNQAGYKSSGFKEMTGFERSQLQAMFKKITDTAWYKTWSSGLMNITADQMFRWRYMKVAMDTALNTLNRNKSIDHYLFKADPVTWEMVENANAKAMLTLEFAEQLWRLIGTSPVEGGTNTTWGMFNKFYGTITQWATRYTNNTIRQLAWGTYFYLAKAAWSVSEGLYKWIGGDWIVNRYTQEIRDWTPLNDISWIVAHDLISRPEYRREMIKVVDAWQMMMRMWKEFGCRNEDGSVNIKCSFEKFFDAVTFFWQAVRTAHPLINQLWKFVAEMTISPAHWDFEVDSPRHTIIAESFIRNMMKPFARSFAVANIWPKIYADMRDMKLERTEENIKSLLVKHLLNDAEAFLYYVEKDISSYMHWDTIYTPSSLVSKNVEALGVLMDDYKEWVHSEVGQMKRLNREMAVWATISTNLPILKYFINPFDKSDSARDLIEFMGSKKDILSMTRWEIPASAWKNENFMDYVINMISKDTHLYSADFEGGKRYAPYNEWEEQFNDTILQRKMKELSGKNPDLNWLPLVHQSIKDILWAESYERFIDIKSDAYDVWEKGSSLAFLELVANMQYDTPVAGKLLVGFLYEMKKAERMEEAGVRFNSDNAYTREERRIIKDIERKTAMEYAEDLYDVDFYSWNSMVMKYVYETYPEVKDHKALNQIRENDKVKYTTKRKVEAQNTAEIALFVDSLSKRMIELWYSEWFEVRNAIMEAIGSPRKYNKKDNSYEVDDKLLANYANTIIQLDNNFREEGIPELDRTFNLLWAIAADPELWTYMNENKEFIEWFWQERVDTMNQILYWTYKNIKWLDEAMDYLKDKETIETLFKTSTYKKSGTSGGWSRSIKYGSDFYYWKNSSKDYDRYKMFYPKLLERGSQNFKYLSNSYAKGPTYSTAGWGYTDRQYRYLQARARWNPIVSKRLAPDIQIPSSWFAKRAGKVRLAYGTWAIRDLKTKTPRFVASKTVARGEWHDRRVSDKRIKKYNP